MRIARGARVNEQSAFSKPFTRLDLGPQVAAALKHMHERNILHLDVKPDNIYIGRDGQYKLGDFGLAVIKGGQRVGSSEGDSK